MVHCHRAGRRAGGHRTRCALLLGAPLRSWQAQSQLEWDIAQEVFTPFSNRRLLEALLGVPANEIGHEGTALLREIMAVTEPGLLEVPFNPRTFRYRALDTFQRGRNRLRREARRLLR
jgi:hypothetical protein